MQHLESRSIDGYMKRLEFPHVGSAIVWAGHWKRGRLRGNVFVSSQGVSLAWLFYQAIETSRSMLMSLLTRLVLSGLIPSSMSLSSTSVNIDRRSSETDACRVSVSGGCRCKVRFTHQSRKYYAHSLNLWTASIYSPLAACISSSSCWSLWAYLTNEW